MLTPLLNHLTWNRSGDPNEQTTICCNPSGKSMRPSGRQSSRLNQTASLVGAPCLRYA